MNNRYPMGRRRRESSLLVRFLMQVLRFALIGFFLYVAYLGLMWRQASVSTEKSSPEKKPPVAAPALPAR